MTRDEALLFLLAEFEEVDEFGCQPSSFEIERCRICPAYIAVTALANDCGWSAHPIGQCGDPVNCSDKIGGKTIIRVTRGDAA